MNRRGMTLVEVILSQWLLFVVMVLAVGTLHRVVRHNRQQEHVTRAAFLAHQKMEQVLLKPPRRLKPETGYFEAPFHEYFWRLKVEHMVPEEGLDYLYLTVVVKGPDEARFELSTHRLGWSNRLWFSSNNNEAKQARLYQVFEDGQELQEIDTHGEGNFNDSEPTMSPDGSEVVFVSDRSKQRQLYRMPADGSAEPIPLTDHPRGAREPHWSPTGKRLAYTAHENGFSQVWVMNLETGETENASRRQTHEGHPIWSPDGKKLAIVVSNRGKGSSIAVMSPEGGTPVVLVEGPGLNTALDWSADGKRLAFMSNRTGNAEIYVHDLEKHRIEQVTFDPGYDSAPRFSPDGEKLLFWSNRNGAAELFIKPLNGKVRVLMKKDEPLARGLFEKTPCWVPRTRASLD